MKNTIKFLGVIAIIAIVGFSMAACADGDYGYNAGVDGTYIGEFGRVVLSGGSITIYDGVTSSASVEMSGSYKLKAPNIILAEVSVNLLGTATKDDWLKAQMLATGKSKKTLETEYDAATKAQPFSGTYTSSSVTFYVEGLGPITYNKF